MPKIALLNVKGEKIKDIKLSDEVFGIEPNKPWRQKGTGNARQGSIRAPHFVGGGVVFGPTTERNYTKKQNRKERRLALKSALTYKARENGIVVVENIELSSNKTKDFIK